jgi:hypothetical protein
MTKQHPLHTQQFATEAAMGSAFYTWAHNIYLHLHGLLFHVPNEIPRAKGETKTDHMRRIQHLKAQGLVSGVPDYVYMGEPAKNKPAMLIELKLPNGTVSPEQKRLHSAYQAAGLEIHVVRTFAEWEALIARIVA